MMCLFQMSETNIKSNEDFRKVLEKRIKIFVFILIIGIITGGVAVGASLMGYTDATNDWLVGLYSGIGSGLIAISIIKIIRFKQIMKDENRLKQERLKNYDERNRQIAAKAIQTATIVVLIISYIVMLIAAFFDRTIFYCFWWIVILFTFCYTVFFNYFNKKM